MDKDKNNENTYGLAIAVTIVVVVLFFGGWYLFISQVLSGPTSPAPVVYGTSTENAEIIDNTPTSVDATN